MIIGFTGTRYGCTERQLARLVSVITEMRPGRAHHGDCVGADQQFHDICRRLGWWMVGHPPIIATLRANCICDEYTSTLNYLARDRRIVDSVECMVACPNTVRPKHGSGTWYTIMYARKKSTPMFVIYPDGRIVRENLTA